jgi:nucleoside-diphosphate-sugar epimerase
MACINRLIEASVFNVERLAEFGWQYTVDLEQGLARTYQWFKKTNLLYAVD